MKIAKKNNLKNIFLNKHFYPYYYKKIILKMFKKSLWINKNNHFISIKINNLTKNRQISRQINLCKITGSLKRSFNVIGVGRHQLRNLFNTNKITHWKKNSW